MISRLHWGALVVLMGCLCACGVKKAMSPGPRPSLPSRQAVSAAPLRGYLANGFDEDEVGQIYTYILIYPAAAGATPPAVDVPLLARTFWREWIVPLDATPGSNPVFWLLEGMNPETGRNQAQQSQWKILAKHYHYARAKMILDRLEWIEPGCFVVAAHRPLGRLVERFTGLQQPALFVNLTQVPAEDYVPVLRAFRSRILEARASKTKALDVEGLRRALIPVMGKETEARVFLHPAPLKE